MRKALKRFLDCRQKRTDYLDIFQTSKNLWKSESFNLIVLAEWLPHFLQLLLQLCLVAVTKLLSAHLLGGGKGVKSLFEVEMMLFLQRVRRHIGQVSTTHLKKYKNKKLSRVEAVLIGTCNLLSPCSCNTDLLLLPRLPGYWPLPLPGEIKWGCFFNCCLRKKERPVKTCANYVHTMSMVFGCGRSSPW